MNHAKRLAAAIATSIALQAVSSRAAVYSIVDLGTLGGTMSQAFDVNNSGHVVGFARTASGQDHAFLYDGVQMYDLGTLGGTRSSAAAINDAGKIVGFSYIAGNTAQRAFLYQSGSMQNLGTMGGNNSLAEDINENGTVVGYGQLSNGSVRGFLWDGVTMHQTGTLPGGTQSFATGVNELEQIVGRSGTSGVDNEHAFRYQSGVMTDLGTLGGNISQAFDINEDGTASGFANQSSGGNAHAVKFKGGSVIDLGNDLVGGSSSEAYALNDDEVVVGAYRAPATDDLTAFVHFPGDAMFQNLNSLLLPGSPWYLVEARGINNLGQIVGWGTINGETHAFLATPVPELSSLLFCGCGLAVACLPLARRRKR